jgi:serine/threonine-protein kinase RsbW
MRQQQRKTIEVPSDLASVARVQEVIIRDVESYGYSQDAEFAVRLALDEALANAIHHGNGSDRTKKVTVEYRVTAEQVEVMVCDEGTGFNPDLVPDPTLPENLAKPSGRGIMLMRAYMSSVRFNERGNCVTLTVGRDRSRAVRSTA